MRHGLEHRAPGSMSWESHRRRVDLMGLLDKLKDLLSKNSNKVDTAIDKAGDVVDDKTQGKYKDTVDKVQEQAKKAVDEGNLNT